MIQDCVVVQLLRTAKLEDNSEGELDGEETDEGDEEVMVIDS